MSSNITNQVSYLRSTRSFPKEAEELTEELSKAYLDTATAVNTRTIGIHPKNRAAIGGESWFLTSKKQQNFRQVYTFDASTGSTIPHGLKFNSISMFTKPYGSYYDGTNYYGVIYATSVAISGQITFWIDPININIVNGGGGAPAIISGIIVLEWISQP